MHFFLNTSLLTKRRILKEKGKATSYMGAEAVKGLLKKTGTSPDEIELIICATVTGDMHFPATANLIAHKSGLKNAWGYDLSAACSGFLFGLETANRFILSGYKKVILVGADMMSSITDYSDRSTCPLFGDAAGACLIEPTEDENAGIIDHILKVDGSGAPHLHMKAGGSLLPPSAETVEKKLHYMYQDGQAVFKVAVSKMSDVALEMMEKHNLSSDEIDWLVPHQANNRIIEATARRMNLPREKVMINIERYGNTTAATIPLCLWEWEKQLKKGDNLILTAFGGGYTWGAIYLKWAYDSK